MYEYSTVGRERVSSATDTVYSSMRIPIPKNSLLTLALVGAVLTGTLTVALANPAEVTYLRSQAASWIAPEDADLQPVPSIAVDPATTGASASPTAPDTVADTVTPATTAATAPAATVQPTATSAPAAQAPPATPAAATPAALPATPPTPVANFTPEVQQPRPRTGEGGDEYYEHERDDDDGHDDD